MVDPSMLYVDTGLGVSAPPLGMVPYTVTEVPDSATSATEGTMEFLLTHH